MENTLLPNYQSSLDSLQQKKQSLLNYQSKFVDLDSPHNKFLLALEKIQLVNRISIKLQYWNK